MLALVAIAAVAAGSRAEPPRKVASISLDDLVCISDVIAVGRVTRVTDVAIDWNTSGGPPPEAFAVDGISDIWCFLRVPVVEFELEGRIKGTDSAGRSVVNASEWLFDATEVPIGERGLLFLQSDRSFAAARAPARAAYIAAFGETAPMVIAWSGAGRALFRPDLAPEQFVTLRDVIQIPSDLNTIDGPWPDSPSIRSIALESLTSRIATIVQRQHGVWLRAEAVVPSDPSQSWRLEVSRDRVAKLSLGYDPTAPPRQFAIDAGTFFDAREELEILHRTVVPLEHGRRARGGTERKIEISLREPAVTVLLHPLGEPRTDLGFLGMAAVERATGAWKVVRGLLDDARCFDGSAEDTAWLAASR